MTTRHPPRNYNPDEHYMGNHVLFHNASTAKRFPLLATVPQEELARMFSVPMIDKVEERNRELMFHEPHVDKKDTGTSSRRGGAGHEVIPFVPTNSSTAKQAISRPPGSVFCGPDAYEDVSVERVRRLESRDRQRGISEKPFSSGSAADAKSRIQNNTYMYAMDSDTLQRVRDMTSHRIKTNREMFEAREYGRSPDRQQRQNQSRSGSSRRSNR